MQDVAALRAELTDLRRYCALNYMAVVKAAKKRNRHLRARGRAGGRSGLWEKTSL